MAWQPGGTKAKWWIWKAGEECLAAPASPVQLAGHSTAAQYESSGNCKREIIASLWDGSFPKLQLATRLAGERRRKKCFPAALKSQEISAVQKWLWICFYVLKLYFIVSFPPCWILWGGTQATWLLTVQFKCVCQLHCALSGWKSSFHVFYSLLCSFHKISGLICFCENENLSLENFLGYSLVLLNFWILYSDRILVSPGICTIFPVALSKMPLPVQVMTGTMPS